MRGVQTCNHHVHFSLNPEWTLDARLSHVAAIDVMDGDLTILVEQNLAWRRPDRGVRLDCGDDKKKGDASLEKKRPDAGATTFGRQATSCSVFAFHTSRWACTKNRSHFSGISRRETTRRRAGHQRHRWGMAHVGTVLNYFPGKDFLFDVSQLFF